MKMTTATPGDREVLAAEVRGSALLDRATDLLHALRPGRLAQEPDRQADSPADAEPCAQQGKEDGVVLEEVRHVLTKSGRRPGRSVRRSSGPGRNGRAEFYHMSSYSRAPRRAVAQTCSSGCGATLGMTAKRSSRSFALFSSKTATTCSWETGGVPSTPTSWSVTIEMFA